MSLQIVEISDTRTAAQLEKIGPDVRAALESALASLATRIGADARARAAAHIHYQGRKNPGSYLASIKDGVASRDKRVVGWVRSGHPLAHLLEFGANPPPHEILPSAGDVLAFFWQAAGDVYLKKVNHPGADIPAYPAITPAFAAARGDIRHALEEAAKKGGRR